MYCYTNIIFVLFFVLLDVSSQAILDMTTAVDLPTSAGL